MEFTRTEIPDVILCKPTLFGDERGYFYETFKKNEFEAFLGEEIHFCQDNEAKSSVNVLRGLHYQLPPFAQSKLVRVIKGKVLDVAVDIRRKSPTFGKYVAIELSEENKLQLFVPKGFAHGYVSLENETIFSYKVDNYYNKNSERGILYNDVSININWGKNDTPFIISEKDTIQPTFNNAEVFE